METYLFRLLLFRNFSFERIQGLEGFLRIPLTDERVKSFDQNLLKHVSTVLQNVKN